MSNKIIKIDDVEGKVYEIDEWKPAQATQVKNHFTEKFKELKEAYDLDKFMSSKVPNYKTYASMVVDREKQLECLAKNIYFEARNEPFVGQFAVALVTLNRVHDTDFPNTVCEVVYEGVHTASGFPKRDRCQFSWYCDGKSDNPSNKKLYQEKLDFARKMLDNEGQWVDITDGALFYHANYVRPSWRKKFIRTTEIDKHIFYRWDKK